MIKINKPINAPEVRFVHSTHPKRGQLKWRVAQAKLLSDFRTDPNQFVNGNYPFSADFGKTEYRNALKACQGNKCCFCEKPVATADIEHFRPKSAWQQEKPGRQERPGYYWLAYSWSNMLIACSDCNSQANKGNLFPVNGVRAVFSSDCRTEDKVLINPTEEDPSNYITFRLEVPVGIDANGRGNANIKIFNLRERGDLIETRRDRLARYRNCKKILSLPANLNTRDEINEAKIFIAKAQKTIAPFAGMIKENIKNGLL